MYAETIWTLFILAAVIGFIAVIISLYYDTLSKKYGRFRANLAMNSACLGILGIFVIGVLVAIHYVLFGGILDVS